MMRFYVTEMRLDGPPGNGGVVKLTAARSIQSGAVEGDITLQVHNPVMFATFRVGNVYELKIERVNDDEA